MKLVLRLLIALSLIAVVLAAALAWFFHRSSPLHNGTEALPGCSAPVEVYFDNYGIPHIYAANAADAYRAFGFVHAQDRLFQMELLRRLGHGRLAEVLGPELADTDAFFRTLGTHRQAQRDAAAFHTLPTDLQQVVLAYLEGVNAFVDRGRLPVEFTLTGINPEPFTPADVYAIAAYMAYNFAYALRTDPIVEHIHLTLDSTYLADFNLYRPAHVQALTQGDAAGFAPKTEGAQVHLASQLVVPPFLEKLPMPTLQGSNAWAIAPSRSASGRAMIANDTHIGYGAPSVWYEAHLNYPGFELYGNYFAGIPLALVGHSRHHAWGVTMFEDDDSDFFVHRLAAPDTSATEYGSSQKPVSKHLERIAVMGRPDTTFTVYDTDNGPLINAFLPHGHPEPVAMYWNYTCIDNTLLEAFYTMNAAPTMGQFREAAAKVGSPGLNIVYADTSGNIAAWSCSRLVRRAPHTDGASYLRGYHPDDAYEGFHDFATNPAVVNPPEGYIASANQYHDPVEGIDYPGYYAPDHRHHRINALIGATPSASMNHMKQWITDVTSPAEAAVAHTLCGILTTSGAALSEKETAAVRQLSLWEGDHPLDAVGPALHYLWLYHVLDLTLRDELGDTLFNVLLSTHLLSGAYPTLIANEASPWWGNAQPGAPSTRSTVVEAAFRKSMATLEEKLGPDPSQWQWQQVHTLEHKHPLGEVAALRKYFNVGPMALPGGEETVNNAGFKFNPDAENKVHYGPAMRILIDMADVEAGVSVLPTGNSGNVLSRHYSDQTEMHISGGFRPMLMNHEVIRLESKKLEFTP